MFNKLTSQARNFLYFLEAKACRNKNAIPRSVLFPVIWVTNRCNLKCLMCDQWKTPPGLLSEELTTKEWFSFIDSASRMHASVIVITGGEPLLREDLPDIINYIRRRDIACHLCTNGTLLNEDIINKLKASKLNSISVSLDSFDPGTHNKLRGTDCFNDTVRNIKLLRRIAPTIKIGINYVITKQNFRNLYRMVYFAEELGVDQIKFDPIHTNLKHRQKSSHSFEGLILKQEDLVEFEYEIDRLIIIMSQTKLLTNSRFFMQGLSGLFRKEYYKLLCYAGYVSCAIDAFGRVSPCDNFDGSISLREKPLEEIWRSYSFQQFRKKVHNCHASCWDTTHAELNIRCSNLGFLKGFPQIIKETLFYNS